MSETAIAKITTPTTFPNTVVATVTTSFQKTVVPIITTSTTFQKTVVARQKFSFSLLFALSSVLRWPGGSRRKERQLASCSYTLLMTADSCCFIEWICHKTT